MTGGYGHYNICVFHDAHYTPENAKLYLEAWDHGSLRDLKEKMDANDEELRRIHVLNCIVQLTSALFYLHFWFQVILYKEWISWRAEFRDGNNRAYGYPTRPEFSQHTDATINSY